MVVVLVCNTDHIRILCQNGKWVGHPSVEGVVWVIYSSQGFPCTIVGILVYCRAVGCIFRYARFAIVAASRLMVHLCILEIVPSRRRWLGRRLYIHECLYSRRSGGVAYLVFWLACLFLVVGVCWVGGCRSVCLRRLLAFLE